SAVGEAPADIVAEREGEQRCANLNRPDELRRPKKGRHQARARELQPQRDDAADESKDEEGQAVRGERRPPSCRRLPPCARCASDRRGDGAAPRRIGPIGFVRLGREIGFVGAHARAAPWAGEWGNGYSLVGMNWKLRSIGPK